ncbi:hypothetical protein C0J52_00545 [Blattella germanica]|nr:hypothetical protein C0J52_00545 [Blattella germanica]
MTSLQAVLIQSINYSFITVARWSLRKNVHHFADSLCSPDGDDRSSYPSSRPPRMPINVLRFLKTTNSIIVMIFSVIVI